MNLRRVLTKECVVPELKASDKAGILVELIDLLVATGRVTDREAALKAVQERERKMSTGLQDGIAIPHGKTDSVTELMAAFGCKREGVPFESLDGKPARMFLLTLSPLSRTGPHIQFLAEMSRTLHNDETRALLLQTTTAEAMTGILWGDKADAPAD